MSHKGPLPACLSLSLLSWAALAQDEPPAVKTTITVTAKPSPVKTEITDDIRALPANASVLFDPATEVSNAREPGEIIRALPGMDFVYYGQGGIPSGPSVRGYTDRNFGQDIAGFLDGIPLNLFGFVASHGALDLTPLLPQAIERVELIRGPFTARYGDFHRGGSLNFVTRRRIPRASVDLAAGSFATGRSTFTYGTAPGDNGRAFYTILEGYRTGNYSRNSDLHRINSYSKLALPAGGNEVTVSGAFFSSRWDAPSYLDLAQIRSGAVSDKDVVNPTDGGDLDSQLLYVTCFGNGTAGHWSATLYGGHRTWNRWRHDQLISPSTQQLHQLDDRFSLGTRLEKSFGGDLLGRPSLLLTGVTLHRDDADTEQERTLRRQVVARVDDVGELLTQSAIYLQEQWSVTPKLKISGGLRYNRVDYDLDDDILAEGRYVSSYSASRLNPNLGFAWSPFGNDAVLVYAGFGSGMRSPTPRTEVRNSLGSVGRVAIARTRNYETGVAFHFANGIEMQAGVFRSDNSKEVRSIPPGIEFESLGRSRRKGAEFDLAWFFSERTTRLYAHLSWVEARLLTPANPAAIHLPDIARYVHRAGFEKTLAAGAGGVLLGGDWAWYGRKDLNTIGTIRSDPYQRATARVTWMPPGGRHRIWMGGFYYPASRYGESAFLFGSRVGVRANPRASFEAGVSRAFW